MTSATDSAWPEGSVSSTVIAGTAGGRFQSGTHVRNADGTPIANLWMSMGRTMGIGLKQLGDSTGQLEELGRPDGLADL